ncbi:hypothetical protein QJQ45_004711 [Haematococcus lacustris]|nr:hypothetical protein QJQ45_004711 [Haematococcus lacustris]
MWPTDYARIAHDILVNIRTHADKGEHQLSMASGGHGSSALVRRAGWKPPAGQVELRMLRPAWSQQHDWLVRGLMWCPVVAPRKPPQAPRSSQAATQPAASEPGPSTPMPAKHSKPAAEPTKGRGKAQGKAAKAKPAPQPGRWVDRECNAALNMQRIGESRWRPLELCWWPEQTALPAKGKEYPGLGYERCLGLQAGPAAAAACCGTVMCAPLC